MFKRPQRHDVLSLNPIDEIVGVTFGATSAQSHFAERAGKFAGAARDGQHGVAAVIERPLDRQLALIQAQSPEAFPGLPRHGAEADALVGADFVLIVGIVNLVREAEDVAASPRVGHCIGGGVSHRYSVLSHIVLALEIAGSGLLNPTKLFLKAEAVIVIALVGDLSVLDSHESYPVEAE